MTKQKIETVINLINTGDGKGDGNLLIISIKVGIFSSLQATRIRHLPRRLVRVDKS